MDAFKKTKRILCIALAVAAVLIVLGPGTSSVLGQTLPRRMEKMRFEKLDFKVEHTLPMGELLPTAPKAVAPKPLNMNDLALVPEVHFQEPIIIKSVKVDKKLSKEERDAQEIKLAVELEKAVRKAMIQNAHQIAKINYLNLRQRDLFMEVLVDNRPDLAGLPFVMGDECRMPQSDRKDFKTQIDLIGGRLSDAVETGGVQRFWRDDDDHVKEGPKKKAPAGKERFRIAAFMQILGPQTREYQAGLVPRLATLSNSAEKEATEALARMAVFAADPEVRQSAATALQKLPASPATAVLLKGLRYPWPSVAQSSADAIVQLKRVDLIPELIKLLEEPDPRAPVLTEDNGRKSPMVRELVRINHHRNCLLCHPPANTADILRFKVPANGAWSKTEEGVQSLTVRGEPEFDPEVVVAPMPTPGSPFRISSYGFNSTPDIFVRADVTYLRQDFSMLHRVEDADPWPAMQRFDYLVRSRVLTETEVETYRKSFGGAGNSPYRQAALSALRRLTGKDAGTTAEQWLATLGL